mmetsp:Transcript_8280/g.15611  ORF Transcript_8280/g.15611 Transcript_8280/m.15611 type:complete len:503 (+) Transcript_8280:306-1814(+)|eukprot:CAMPEP_0114417150 /NCGR_PEP_ID=MMETSP0103-20121206/2808_1 /TAXON_ID=37642 ORGANISM="Paraphysomonas imperforata, Strain PA2" /NCGR_SAMPLE_ID=MMETSP0103 /ASSEMBLY_ACC=CAM_ASM_000201 /LENGTH=502 /DNA_ID=CAMNT_0001585419 /DNA_START=80 /DNA_END=1588 /DNA_ORIENTATION=+
MAIASTDYYCKEKRVDLSLDLHRLYRKIRKDKEMISNKYFGISLNKNYPRLLSCHRGVSRQFRQTLQRNVQSQYAYSRVDSLQHTIKNYHDVSVTMDSSQFFRICEDLLMESEFIEIRCCRNDIRFASVDLFDKKYCEEIICSPLHLNIDIRWVNQASAKIVFGLFETQKLLHFKSFKKYTPKVNLLMRFVDIVDAAAKQDPCAQELRSNYINDDYEHDDGVDVGGDTEFSPVDSGSVSQGLGMDLKLFFDFGPLLGTMSLGVFPHKSPLWSSASGVFTHPSTRYTDSSTILNNDSYMQDTSHYLSSGSESENSFLRCESRDERPSFDEGDDSWDEGEKDGGGDEVDFERSDGNDEVTATTSSLRQKIDGLDLEKKDSANDNLRLKKNQEGLPIMFNDYEIGHVRSSDDADDSTIYANNSKPRCITAATGTTPKKMTKKQKLKAEEEEKKRSEEAARKALYEHEVEDHVVNKKYRELKKQLSLTDKRASMHSARSLWFDEMS